MRESLLSCGLTAASRATPSHAAIQVASTSNQKPDAAVPATVSSRRRATVTQQPDKTPTNVSAIDHRRVTKPAAAYSAAASRVAASSAGRAKRVGVDSL